MASPAEDFLLHQVLAGVPQIGFVLLIGALGPRTQGPVRRVLLAASLVLPTVLGILLAHRIFHAVAWSPLKAVAGLVLVTTPPLGAWFAVFALRRRSPWVGTAMSLVVGGALVFIAPWFALVVMFVPCMLTHCM